MRKGDKKLHITIRDKYQVWDEAFFIVTKFNTFEDQERNLVCAAEEYAQVMVGEGCYENDDWPFELDFRDSNYNFLGTVKVELEYEPSITGTFVKNSLRLEGE